MLRYAVPLILFVAYISCLPLAAVSVIYEIIFGVQTAFYFLGLVGWLLERSGRRVGVLAMPLYFLLANLASAVAFYKFLRGETYTRWDPIRETR